MFQTFLIALQIATLVGIFVAVILSIRMGKEIARAEQIRRREDFKTRQETGERKS